MMDAVAGSDAAIRRGPAGVFTPGGPMASEAGMAVLDRPARPRPRRSARWRRRATRASGSCCCPGTDVPRINAICEVMADLCRKLGMNLDLVATDWGTVNQRILSPKPLDQGGWSMFGIFSGGLDHLSPAYHLVDPRQRPRRRSELADRRAAGGVAQPPGSRRRISHRRRRWRRGSRRGRLEVGAYIPCGQYFQPTAYRRDLDGMLTGLPLFWNLRRSA